jgi:hypothetical protein
MTKRKPRTSTKREKLPELINSYLLGLEGELSSKEMRGLLSDDVRWSRDGKTWVEGKEAVCDQIETWRSTVVSAVVGMQRMQDYEDGCVKVDFTVQSDVRSGTTEYQVLQGVVAVYMVEDQQINEILEHWQAVPAEARDYQ